jgi:hypothetical protein
MNLVQIIERLKDLPEQVIRQYANGMNPEIPAYVALGELERRERVAQQMATAQGAAQGPQPSIKEQIEQKAGLMAAQGLQQQQMMQQMAQQRVPGPVPAGIPQPTDQPEAQPTMMAARGGLARAPVNFNFQHGGIVAFNGEDGSDVTSKKDKYETPYDRMNRENREEAERKKREPAKPLDAQAAEDRKALAGLLESLRGGSESAGRAIADVATMIPRGLAGAYDTAVVRPMRAAGVDAAYLAPKITPEGASVSSMTPFTDVARARETQRPAAPVPPMTSAQPTEQTYVRKAGPTPAAPIADLKALADQQRRQQAPRPAPAAVAPAAPAAPTQPAPESMDALFRAQLGKAPKERTVEEIQAEQRAIREGAGMTGPAGAAQLERIRKLQEQYEGSKPSGLDDLIRVFGQSGQYKGLSGLAPAYTANADQKRAADLAMAKQINDLMSGVETTQRGEMKDIASGTSTARATDRAAGVDFTKNLLSTLNTARGNDLTAASNEAQRKTLERGQDIQLQVAKIQSSAMQAARAQGADDKTIAAAEAAFARDPEAKALSESLKMFALNPNSPNYQSALQKLQAIQASKYRQFGIKLEGAPGAGSPGGTPPDIQALLKQYPGGK